MLPTKVTPVLALVLIAAAALAQSPYEGPEPLVPGTNPTVLYDNCYPNACVGRLTLDHWPFTSIMPTPPRALVAIGSPAFGDYYNLTNQLLYLGVTLNPPVSRWFGRPIIPGNIKSGLRNLTTGIGIGFTALGEFVATLDNGIGGGLALARYNTANSDLEKTEIWATKDISSINPAEWINGWTLSANLTIKDDSNQKNYWIFLHAFAVYSNISHAGGGRGVALNITTALYGTPLSYPPNRWRLLPFTSADIKPFTIVYDSPRLLIATGGVMKTVNLATLGDGLPAVIVTIDVNFTLVFPKAWPYAIVYYNYSVTAARGVVISPIRLYLNSTAFSIRFEIVQVNGAPVVGTYNATIFTLTTPAACAGGGVGYNLLHATPNAMQFRNITMFAAVYPKAKEFTPMRFSNFVPYKTNNFNIVLPTGYQRATLASEGGSEGDIPLVILQWSSGRLDYLATTPAPATYRNGTMFVYGYAYNVTNWVAAKSPDPYIRALVERTVLHLPTFTFGGTQVCGHFHDFKLGVVGSMADPTDVLALSYGARFFFSPWFGLDVAPGAFQNLYTGSSTTGMAGFIGLRNFGGLPVVLARRSSTFPYFYDSYNRFALNKTYMLNTLMVQFDPSTIPPGVRYTTLTVGGPVVNMFTRYTQDFVWYAPFIHDYMTAPFPFSFSNYYMAHSPYIGSLFTAVWNSARLFTATNTWPPVTNAPTVGYAIISTAVDPNGTVIMQIWGANAQDTYYAAKLLNDRWFDFDTAPVHIVVFTYRYNWPYPYNPPPHFVTADVYKLSPIMRPELLNTYRLKRVPGPPVDIKFEP